MPTYTLLGIEDNTTGVDLTVAQVAAIVAPLLPVTDPIQQAYAPGAFTVLTGKYVILSKRLQLTGSQRVTIAGTARVRIT